MDYQPEYHVIMTNKLLEVFARNFKHPEHGPVGYIVKNIFKKRNKPLEEFIVKLCKIEPHHRVLEVGFGPGLGLKAAHEIIKGNDKGKVYGIEISVAMETEASRLLQNEINSGKVSIQHGDVANIPYNNDFFDRVFHCNSFYFWPDMKKATDELYRVMGQSSRIVTAMNLTSVRKAKAIGFLKYGDIDSKRYVNSLISSGFQSVCAEDMKSKTGYEIRIITAEIDKKQK